jgi:hypothetical protein
VARSSQKFIRNVLGLLLLLVAINALGGGYYGMSGAKNVPIEWLEGSPFANYFIPSLILFIGIGGSCFFAAIAVFRRHPIARISAFVSGLTIIAWLTVQIEVIGYVSWMQPITAVAGFLILYLTWIFPKT